MDIIPLEACFKVADGVVTGRCAKRVAWCPEMSREEWRLAMDQVAQQSLPAAVDAVLIDIEAREISSAFGHAMATFLLGNALSLSKINLEKARTVMRAVLRHGKNVEGSNFRKRYIEIATQLGMGPKG